MVGGEALPVRAEALTVIICFLGVFANISKRIIKNLHL
jgi:hypothetical protein